MQGGGAMSPGFRSTMVKWWHLLSARGQEQRVHCRCCFWLCHEQRCQSHDPGCRRSRLPWSSWKMALGRRPTGCAIRATFRRKEVRVKYGYKDEGLRRTASSPRRTPKRRIEEALLGDVEGAQRLDTAKSKEASHKNESEPSKAVWGCGVLRTQSCGSAEWAHGYGQFHFGTSGAVQASCRHR